MKYQKRYKPKTKFEIFLKVYFIIGILVIVLTGVYASVKSMQRKKEVASETIIHTVAVPKISLKKNRMGWEKLTNYQTDVFSHMVHILIVKKWKNVHLMFMENIEHTWV